MLPEVFLQVVSAPAAFYLAGMVKKPARNRRKSTLRAEPPAVLRVIGERIRQVRQAQGLSQDRLAYSVPMDRAHIGSIERGIKAPTVLTLLRIAQALEVEVGSLFPPMAEVSPLIPRKDPYAMRIKSPSGAPST